MLLADGSSKPVEEVGLGDRVVATDPETGETASQKVVATIVGHGEKDLVEVTVDVDGEAGDAVSTLVATAEHSFWVDEHGRLLNPAVHGLWGEVPGWYHAEDLDRRLAAYPQGEKVRVVGVRAYTATTRSTTSPSTASTPTTAGGRHPGVGSQRKLLSTTKKKSSVENAYGLGQTQV